MRTCCKAAYEHQPTRWIMFGVVVKMFRSQFIEPIKNINLKWKITHTLPNFFSLSRLATEWVNLRWAGLAERRSHGGLIWIYEITHNCPQHSWRAAVVAVVARRGTTGKTSRESIRWAKLTSIHRSMSRNVSLHLQIITILLYQNVSLSNII